MAAVHNEKRSPTTYSNIYDLKRGIVHVYHFHNFENAVTFDLAEELKKGKRHIELPSLFPRTFAWEVFKKEKVREVEKRSAGRKVVAIEDAVRAPLVGRYAVPDEIYAGAVIEVFVDEGKLFGRFNDEARFEMKPESQTEFFLIRFDRDYDFTFVHDDTGKVVELRVETSGTKFTCPRMK